MQSLVWCQRCAARVGALLFGARYVRPLNVIEQRYYLPILALLCSFRAARSTTVERVQSGWSLLLSALLLQQAMGVRVL